MAASESALPGDLLYPLKLRIEQLRMAIAPAHLHDELVAVRARRAHRRAGRLVEAGATDEAVGLVLRSSRAVRGARRIERPGERSRTSASAAQLGAARTPCSTARSARPTSDRAARWAGAAGASDAGRRWLRRSGQAGAGATSQGTAGQGAGAGRSAPEATPAPEPTLPSAGDRTPIHDEPSRRRSRSGRRSRGAGRPEPDPEPHRPSSTSRSTGQRPPAQPGPRRHQKTGQRRTSAPSLPGGLAEWREAGHGAGPTSASYRRRLLALTFASASAPSEPRKKTTRSSTGTVTGSPFGPMPPPCSAPRLGCRVAAQRRRHDRHGDAVLTLVRRRLVRSRSSPCSPSGPCGRSSPDPPSSGSSRSRSR